MHSRGLEAEDGAFYFLGELEAIIREWVQRCYHCSPHTGLCVPEIPGLDMSPLDMLEHGIARAGSLQVLDRPDLACDFLEVRWTTIQHYGVEIGTLRYNGPALNGYRGRTRSHGGTHAGKWPVSVDTGDVTRVWFQDPSEHRWHPLAWEHAAELSRPFSAEAAAHARRLAATTHRFPDTKRALVELLDRTLPAASGTVPGAMTAILAECGGTLPRGAQPLDGFDAHAVAIAATGAVLARTATRAGSDPLLGWIIRGDRDQRRRPEPREILRPYRTPARRCAPGSWPASTTGPALRTGSASPPAGPPPATRPQP